MSQQNQSTDQSDLNAQWYRDLLKKYRDEPKNSFDKSVNQIVESTLNEIKTTNSVVVGGTSTEITSTNCLEQCVKKGHQRSQVYHVCQPTWWGLITGKGIGQTWYCNQLAEKATEKLNQLGTDSNDKLRFSVKNDPLGYYPEHHIIEAQIE